LLSITIDLSQRVELGAGGHAESVSCSQESESSNLHLVLLVNCETIKSDLRNGGLSWELNKSDHTGFVASGSESAHTVLGACDRGWLVSDVWVRESLLLVEPAGLGVNYFLNGFLSAFLAFDGFSLSGGLAFNCFSFSSSFAFLT
jgi:hypothetical protein